jgi:hypothetical protein
VKPSVGTYKFLRVRKLQFVKKKISDYFKEMLTLLVCWCPGPINIFRFLIIYDRIITGLHVQITKNTHASTTWRKALKLRYGVKSMQ